MGYLLEGGIPGDARQHPDARLNQKRFQEPEVAGDVVLADKIDIVMGRDRRFAGPDHVFEQHLTGDPVSQVLGPHKPRRVHRDDADPQLQFGLSADCIDVFAHEAAHTGRIDKDRLGRCGLSGLHDRLIQLLP